LAKEKKQQSVLNQVQQLIKDQYGNTLASRPILLGCANYFANDVVKHYCCQENTDGNICVYFQENLENPRCTYFETYLLPIDNNLVAKYYNYLDVNIKDILKQICGNCKQSFLDKKKKEFCDRCRYKG
jgi:hypothetical protein